MKKLLCKLFGHNYHIVSSSETTVDEYTSIVIKEYECSKCKNRYIDKYEVSTYVDETTIPF